MDTGIFRKEKRWLQLSGQKKKKENDLNRALIKSLLSARLIYLLQFSLQSVLHP